MKTTSHTGHQNPQHGSTLVALALAAVLLASSVASAAATTKVGQGEAARRSLIPLQLEIEKQRQRLSSSEAEERRDAVMRLAALRHPDASRAAVIALADILPIVRATAAGAVLWLPAEQSAAALLPLLDDKDEFVRKEVAYALGKTRSKSAVAALLKRLAKEKKDGVRGA
ncbi:MAG: HEAT repeat domain-containing protein, partial [Pyrinomonadaceae bacterium]